MHRFLVAVVLVGLSTSQAAAGTEQLSWSDLIDPSVQSFEDPFRDLSYEQIDDLRNIVGLRDQMTGPDLTGEELAGAAGRLEALEARLAGSGIDIDWLLSQRWIVAERRATAMVSGNPAVDGRSIVLSGYAIPAPPAEDGTKIAYLVPERGMCSHTPPPNPNQLVRVRLTDDWQPTRMHEPVRLTGRIEISPSEQSMLFVDGYASMQATFLLEVEDVTTSEDLDLRPVQPDSAWITRLRNSVMAGTE